MIRHHTAYLCHPSIQAFQADHQDPASPSDPWRLIFQVYHLDPELPCLLVNLIALLVLVSRHLPLHPVALQIRLPVFNVIN